MSRILFETLIVSCIGLSGQPLFAQPSSPVSVQWKQCIERPTKGWDFDGKWILGHIDQDICLWDAATGQILQRMKGHGERIQKVQFSPDGEHALSSSWISDGPMSTRKSKDTRTILWNLATDRSVHLFPGEVAGEFSPDGKQIVMFSQRADTPSSFDAAVWDVLTGRKLLKVTLDDGSGPYWDALHWSPDGQCIVYFSHGDYLLYNSSAALLYDAGDGRNVGRATAKNGIHRYTSIGALACFDSERASLIDIASGRSLQSIEHGVKGVWRGAWTHDGCKVVTFPTDGAIRIWDVETGTSIIGAQGGQYPRHHAIISPDNSRLAISWGGGSVDELEIEPMVGIYEVDTGAEICVINIERTEFLIGFSPDSKTILISGHMAHLYDAIDGTLIHTVSLKKTQASESSE